MDLALDLDRYKAVLCDLDGCLIAGDTLLPGARTLAQRAGARLVIVSNNSTDTPATLSARLARLGLSVAPERIVLAGATAVDLIAMERPGARLALFGARALCERAENAGLTLAERDVGLALLARDLEFSYARLSRLVALLRQGAELVVANIDASHPTAEGGLAPETGALLQAVRACLPELRYRAIGKPDPTLFRIALRKTGATAAEALFIGDNPVTDGEGARRLGMRFAGIGEGGARDIAELIGASELRMA